MYLWVVWKKKDLGFFWNHQEGYSIFWVPKISGCQDSGLVLLGEMTRFRGIWIWEDLFCASILDVILFFIGVSTLKGISRGACNLTEHSPNLWFLYVQSIYFTESFKPSKILVTNPENPDLFWRGVFHHFFQIPVFS